MGRMNRWVTKGNGVIAAVLLFWSCALCLLSRFLIRQVRVVAVILGEDELVPVLAQVRQADIDSPVWIVLPLTAGLLALVMLAKKLHLRSDDPMTAKDRSKQPRAALTTVRVVLSSLAFAILSLCGLSACIAFSSVNDVPLITAAKIFLMLLAGGVLQ